MTAYETNELNFADVNLLHSSENNALHLHEDLSKRLSLRISINPDLDSNAVSYTDDDASPYETTAEKPCPTLFTKYQYHPSDGHHCSDCHVVDHNDGAEDNGSSDYSSTSTTASVSTITSCESLPSITPSSLVGSASDAEDHPVIQRRVHFALSSSNDVAGTGTGTATQDCSPEELSIVYIPTINRKDYTFEERSNAWYSMKDMLLLKSDTDRTWDDIRHNRMPMERGFEHRKKVETACFIVRNRKKLRSIVRKAILREQKKQKAIVANNEDESAAHANVMDDALARAYAPHSYQSQTLAGITALLDRKVANGILFDDEDSSSVLAMKYQQRHEHGSAGHTPQPHSSSDYIGDGHNTHSPRRRKAILQLLKVCQAHDYTFPGME